MFLTMLFCLLFFMSFHPMASTIILISLIILTTMNLYMMSKNIWLIVMIIMAFISGMMILFLYASSLIPNSKFWSTSNIIYLIPFIFILGSTLSNSVNMNSMNNWSITSIYYLNWMMMFNCLVMIMIMLFFTAKIIYEPFSPLKSSYEKANKKYSSYY